MEFLKTTIEKPLQFVSCGHFTAEQAWKHDLRTIDSYELIVGLTGAAFIQQDDRCYEVREGDVLLLLPGHIHKGYAYSEAGTGFYWLHFHPSGSSELLEEKDAHTELSPLLVTSYINKLSGSILLPPFYKLDNREKVHILTRQLLHASTTDNFSPYMNHYLLTLILIEITGQYIAGFLQQNNNENSGNTKFNSILEWIRINLDKNITVDALSKKFSFNRDYLTRLFQKHLGTSVIKYIHGMRILKSKDLLCQTDKGIKEIAYEIGFSDDKYFMKLFKAHEGLTPSAYRNTFHRTHLNNK